MPLIEIKVFDDDFSDEQRAGIIEAVTDAPVSCGQPGDRVADRSRGSRCAARIGLGEQI